VRTHASVLDLLMSFMYAACADAGRFNPFPATIDDGTGPVFMKSDQKDLAKVVRAGCE
jgi:hypothetical protein